MHSQRLHSSAASNAARRPRRWLRRAAAASLAWAAGLVAMALYERLVVDPWRFIGENRGPVFYTWSSQLVYRASGFGEIALVFDAPRFWIAVLVPIAALFAFAAAVSLLARRFGSRGR